MVGFDGWNARYYGDAMAVPGDVLAHFRTKGSKNGVRRYQLSDGTWTPLGLRLRKAREGWGETRKEQRANKKVARAEKAVARAEKRSARKEARRQKIENVRKKLAKNSLKGLSDAEVQQKIRRAKMEKELRELNRSHVVENGAKVVKYLMDYSARKKERELEREKMGLEAMRLNVDKLRAKADYTRSKEQTKQERSKVKQAKWKAKEQQYDTNGGLKYERKADLKRAKKELREAGLLGSILKNHGKAKAARIEAKSEVKKGKAWVESMLKGQKKIDRYNKGREASERIRAKFDTPYTKAERSLKTQKEQTKQAEARARQAEANAEEAKANARAAASGKKKKKGNNNS